MQESGVKTMGCAGAWERFQILMGWSRLSTGEGGILGARLCRRREWESGSLHEEGPSSEDTRGLLRGEAGQVLGPHGECDGGHEVILGSRAAITKAAEWVA